MSFGEQYEPMAQLKTDFQDFGNWGFVRINNNM